MMTMHDRPNEGTVALVTLGALASCLHHLPHLAISHSVALAGLLGWRVLIWHGAVAAPSKPLLRLLVALVLGLIPLGTDRLLSRETAIALLALFTGLKLLEMHTRRDAQVVIHLSFFLLVTGFVLAQTPLAAIEALLAVWLLVSALIALQMPAPGAGPCLRRAAVLLTQALPLAAVLFVLFPRAVTPLWGITSAEQGRTGLSDSMRPGSIGEIARSDAIALRARFEGPLPPHSALYWRGPVFERFDGETWSGSRSHPFDDPASAVVATGPTATYTVTLEPHQQIWIPALELSIDVPEGADYQHDYQIVAHRPVVARTRYRLTAALEHRARHTGSSRATERLVALPAALNPRTRALAAQWRSEGLDDRAYVARAREFIRTQGLLYTLQPGVTRSIDTVDAFLFDDKTGFCEHFASAFAVLMRAGGIPARIVTGYQGGDFNPIDGQVEIRLDDAHAWTEILLDDHWERIDPTAIAQPGRVELGMARAVPATDPLPSLARVDLPWVAHWRHTLSALSNAWNQYVLGFDSIRQKDLMSSLGLDRLDAGARTGLMLGAIALLLASSLVPMLRQRQRSSRHERLWRRFCRQMAARGLRQGPGEGPEDYTARIAAARPHEAAAVRLAGKHYSALLYGPPAHAAAELAGLEAALRACRR